MDIGKKLREVSVGQMKFKLARNVDGVMQLWADDDLQLAAALGYAHAWDRCVQLCMMRLIGEGRLSECLKANDETLAIDTFMRRQGFAQTAQMEVARLTATARAHAEAYAAGLNEGIRQRGRPWELRLAGYKPEVWEISHTLLIIKLMTYIGLAQCQQDIEKIIIEATAAGVDVARLRTLFSPHLDGFSDELVELVKRTHIFGPTLPQEVRFLAPLPRLIASNNWAVAPSLSATGHALQANDPHLEVNRLPAIWYEFVGHLPNDYRMGISIPGLPGLIMGRNRSVSFGFTYGYMDMVDHFIEDITDQKCRRENGSEPIQHEKQIIKRKSAKPIVVNVFRSSVGVIEIDPALDSIPDGMHLAVAYSAHAEGAAESFAALIDLQHSNSVQETQTTLEAISVSANWVIADREGNIGYQQSGFFPCRSHSGLYPLPAWRAANLWQGRHPPSKLLRITNPAEGYVVTANGAHNQAHGPLAVNLHGGEYRRDRIEAMLGESAKLTLAHMQGIQTDVESLQAHAYLDLIRQWVPATRQGSDLLDWDGRYDVDSLGAPVFETIYQALLKAAFEPVFGEQAWHAIANTTHILFSYYNVFDRVLLGDDESWFRGEGRKALFRRVITETLMELEKHPRRTWGQTRPVTMKHILLSGKLPKFVGLDHGPIALPGTRSTIAQGSVLKSYGRETTFVPSYRFITDLGSDEAFTVLAGGPSERPRSRWYKQDIKLWLSRRYKILSPLAAPPVLPVPEAVNPSNA